MRWRVRNCGISMGSSGHTLRPPQGQARFISISWSNWATATGKHFQHSALAIGHIGNIREKACRDVSLSDASTGQVGPISVLPGSSVQRLIFSSLHCFHETRELGIFGYDAFSYGNWVKIRGRKSVGNSHARWSTRHALSRQQTSLSCFLSHRPESTSFYFHFFCILCLSLWSSLVLTFRQKQ